MHFQGISTLAFVIPFAIIIFHQVNSGETKGKTEKDEGSSVDSLEEELVAAGVKWKEDKSSTEPRLSAKHMEELGQSETKSRSIRSDTEDILNMGELRNSALKYGKYVLEQALNLDFMNLFSSGLSTGKSSSGGGSFFQKRSFQGVNEETPHHQNAFIRWIVSLFSVEGESLSHFLRGYRVHVFYDLLFYIVKFVFYAYVGLLIP